MMKQFLVATLSISISLHAMEQKISFDNNNDIANFLAEKKINRKERLDRAKIVKEKGYDNSIKKEVLDQLNPLNKITKEIDLPGNETNHVTDFCFSPDDNLLAAGTWCGNLLIIQAVTGHKPHHLSLMAEYGAPPSATTLGILAGSIHNIKWEDETTLEFDELRRFHSEKRVHCWNLSSQVHEIIKKDLPFKQLKTESPLSTLNHTKSIIAYHNTMERNITLKTYVPPCVENELHNLSWEQIAALIHFRRRNKNSEYDVTKHKKLLTLSKIPDNLQIYIEGGIPFADASQIAGYLKEPKIRRTCRLERATLIDQLNYDETVKKQVLFLLGFFEQFEHTIDLPAGVDDDTVTNFAFKDDDQRLAVGTLIGYLSIADPYKGKQVATLDLYRYKKNLNPGSVHNIIWNSDSVIQFDEIKQDPPQIKRYLWNFITDSLATVENPTPVQIDQPQDIDPDLAKLGKLPTLNHARTLLAYAHNWNGFSVRTIIPKEVEFELLNLPLKKTVALFHFMLRRQRKGYSTEDHRHLRKNLNALPDSIKKYFALPSLEKK